MDPNLTRQKPTDEELEEAARITEQDIEAAMRAFDEHAPPEARRLLDARVDDEDDEA